MAPVREQPSEADDATAHRTHGGSRRATQAKSAVRTASVAIASLVIEATLDAVLRERPLPARRPGSNRAS